MNKLVFDGYYPVLITIPSLYENVFMLLWSTHVTSSTLFESLLSQCLKASLN